MLLQSTMGGTVSSLHLMHRISKETLGDRPHRPDTNIVVIGSADSVARRRNVVVCQIVELSGQIHGGPQFFERTRFFAAMHLGSRTVVEC